MCIPKEIDKKVDSFELRDKSNGFEIGVLLCFNYHLRGYLCSQCKNKDKCNFMRYEYGMGL